MKQKKVEYAYKTEKIKEIKKDIKDAIQELDHKKQMQQYLLQEYDKLPKDMNRNQYLKRINEIIKNLKSQKEDIRKIHSETVQE